MKLRNVLLALVLVAVPAVAQAQTKTASLTTSGTIASSVTATAVGTTMSFGTLVTGTLNTATGEFTISTNQDVTLDVAFTDLSNAATTTTIPVTGACTIGDLTSTVAFASGCASETFSFFGTKSVYVTATANVADATALPAGVYSGTATFTANYTNY